MSTDGDKWPVGGSTAAWCPHLSTRPLHTNTTIAPVPLTQTASVLIPVQNVLRIAAALKLLSCRIGEAVRGCAPPRSASSLAILRLLSVQRTLAIQSPAYYEQVTRTSNTETRGPRGLFAMCISPSTAHCPWDSA